MQKGHINVTSENIFPIIKKFLYSDHDIFLREIVSNAVDATQKVKTLASVGDYQGELGDLTVHVDVDKENKTITVSDHGVGMTEEEMNKYLNEIAFSSAEEFLEKYKDKTQAIIGHFGLGFYSAFMVSKKVEVISKSSQDDAKAVKWACDGTPAFSIEEVDKKERGTDIVMHIDDESQEFLEESKIQELLDKYCKFLPVPIAFGKEKEYEEGKEVETDKDRIINDPEPLWTKNPNEIKDEDYQQFYQDIYPMQEPPLFHIHLYVDYPFNLTGILYFPKIKNNIEIQKNKIQLYCNQVFVTDSVEGIVPEFLTLLHGVIDSPDIPLNISRSFLQSDSNVKKISSHITKKVGDKLQELFNKDRADFESKWDSLKIFIEYGILTEEKFFDKAQKFSLLKNTEGKFFTFDEYHAIIKENQTDKDNKVVYLYTTDAEEQHSFIEAAKSRGYDVLVKDGQLDTHLVNQLEQKWENSRFVRVDSDIVDKLIPKDEQKQTSLSEEQQNMMRPVFQSQLPDNKGHFFVSFEELSENDDPLMITQSEFMRRMKDMASMSGGGMNFYGEMPDSYNVVLNTAHPLVKKVVDETEKNTGEKVKAYNEKLTPLKEEEEKLKKEQEGKKDEEISTEQKDQFEKVNKEVAEVEQEKNKVLEEYGKKNEVVKQLVDLALLANNMLRGEDLTRFVKRSVDMIK